MSISTSDLDFANIKSKLKTHLKQQSEFADYDFEASGLSNILDVLAYNTHLNGLIANMAINESFLTSAQLRSSVLSHAESLGYTPKSATTSRAIVNATVQIENGPDFLVMDPFTEFATDVDEVSFSFKNTESYTAFNDNGTYVFKNSAGDSNIVLREGQRKRKTFVVGDVTDAQVFVITDENIDTTTLSVNVFDNFTTTEFTVYNNIDSVSTINDQSTIFLIREAANGHYELQFSDGNTLGKTPVSGNKIIVTYMTTVGEPANGGESFITKNISYDNNTYPVIVTTVAESAGGASKESLQSIKLNAPRAYATQQRLVTSEDYEALILRSFGSYLDGVIAWGGNENVPPQYGKVFVSLQFKEGTDESTQSFLKQTIKDQLTSNLSIMSIDTEFVDPKETELELIVAFNVDTTKASSSVAGLQTTIQALISEHFNTELNTFDKVFRRSRILTKIDDLSPGILNSQMSVRGVQSVENVVVGKDRDYVVAFPFEIAVPDKDTFTVTSSIFSYKGQNVLIKNKLGSNQLQILDLNDSVKVTNIGTYDSAKGLITLSGLNVELSTNLKMYVVPANQSTLVPLRNYILSLDESRLSVMGYTETVNSKAVL